VGDWFAGAYRPFCSERCKLIDLGKWLGEEHRISEPIRSEHVQEISDLPSGDARQPEEGDEMP
jgi:hypothetical protein